MTKLSQIIAINLIAGCMATSAMAATAPAQPNNGMNAGQSGGMMPANGSRGSMMQNGNMMKPSQEAMDACKNKADKDSCSFTPPNGSLMQGTCHTPPQQTVITCIPTPMGGKPMMGGAPMMNTPAAPATGK